MSLPSREDDTPKLLIQSFASSAETADQETSMPSMEKTVPPEPDDAVVREQILRRFESWLDDVLSQEEPPQGIVSEILSQLQSDSKPLQTDTENGKGDLYSLWSVLTAQTQETRHILQIFKTSSQDRQELCQASHWILSCNRQLIEWSKSLLIMVL